MGGTRTQVADIILVSSDILDVQLSGRKQEQRGKTDARLPAIGSAQALGYSCQPGPRDALELVDPSVTLPLQLETEGLLSSLQRPLTHPATILLPKHFPN